MRFDTGLREVLEAFAYDELAPEEGLPVGPGDKIDEFVVGKGTTRVEVNVEDCNVVRVENERLPVSRILAEPRGTVDVVLAGYGGEDEATKVVNDELVLLSLRLVPFSDMEVVPGLLSTPDVSEYKVVDKVTPVDALLEFEKAEDVKVAVEDDGVNVTDKLPKGDPVGDSVVNVLPFEKGWGSEVSPGIDVTEVEPAPVSTVMLAVSVRVARDDETTEVLLAKETVVEDCLLVVLVRLWKTKELEFEAAELSVDTGGIVEVKVMVRETDSNVVDAKSDEFGGFELNRDDTEPELFVVGKDAKLLVEVALSEVVFINGYGALLLTTGVITVVVGDPMLVGELIRVESIPVVDVMVDTPALGELLDGVKSVALVGFDDGLDGLRFWLEVTVVVSLAADTAIEVRMVRERESLDTPAEFEGEIVEFVNVDEVRGINDKVLFDTIITVTVEDIPVLEPTVRIVVFVVE